MKISGYKRENGRYGIRNYLLILPASVCSSDTAKRIADNIDGAISIPNQHGCCQIGDDYLNTVRTLVGFAKNPNVGAVLIVGLGCEGIQTNVLKEQIKESGKPVEAITIQQEGGTIKAIAKRIIHNIGTDTLSDKKAASLSVVIDRRNQLHRCAACPCRIFPARKHYPDVHAAFRKKLRITAVRRRDEVPRPSLSAKRSCTLMEVFADPVSGISGCDRSAVSVVKPLSRFKYIVVICLHRSVCRYHVDGSQQTRAIVTYKGVGRRCKCLQKVRNELFVLTFTAEIHTCQRLSELSLFGLEFSHKI